MTEKSPPGQLRKKTHWRLRSGDETNGNDPVFKSTKNKNAPGQAHCCRAPGCASHHHLDTLPSRSPLLVCLTGYTLPYISSANQNHIIRGVCLYNRYRFSRTVTYIYTDILTVPVAVGSSPIQSTPSKDAFLTAQMAPMIAFWSPLPSATKSAYLDPSQYSMKVEPTCRLPFHICEIGFWEALVLLAAESCSKVHAICLVAYTA